MSGSTSNDESVLCYNKGCGKQFHPADNREDSCTFHPGAPVFHDAYKGWSCCNKKCTDFTEFLNIKGCKTSFHNSVKPVEPEKQKPDIASKDEVIEYVAPTPMKRETLQRPDVGVPMTRIPATVAPSLKQLLEKQTNTDSKIQDAVLGFQKIKIGTPCKNPGCKQEYEGDHSDSGTCIYHSGVPIFHEGLKYWSCCQHKTTDFNNFLDQEGCHTGIHKWIKTESDSVKRASCRYDWHQTGSLVVISIYAKGANPEKTFVEANPVKLHVVVSFGDDLFDEEFILNGVIDVSHSSLHLAATKVEVKLRKAEFFSWSKLTFPIELKTEEAIATH